MESRAGTMSEPTVTIARDAWKKMEIRNTRDSMLSKRLLYRSIKIRLCSPDRVISAKARSKGVVFMEGRKYSILFLAYNA